MNFRRSVIVAELWRREARRRWKCLQKFLRFEKWPLTGKFSKFCSKRIHRDTDRRVVFKFMTYGRREIGEMVRCLYLTKNFAWLSSSRYEQMAPKICQECVQSAPDQSREWVTQSDPWPKWPIELLTHVTHDPWVTGAVTPYWINWWLTSSQLTLNELKLQFVVGLLQYWIDYWIVKQWRSTRVKTNEMPFLNFLLVLFLTLSFIVNFL